MLVDASDATSSGAPGDSPAVLRALIEAGYPGRALVPIVDPAAVEVAFSGGVVRVWGRRGLRPPARAGGADRPGPPAFRRPVPQ